MLAVTMSRVCRSWTPLFVLIVTFLSLFLPAVTVKTENFKTCAQSGFCNRNRAFADDVTRLGSGWISPYALEPQSVVFKNGVLTGTVLKTVDAITGETVKLPLTIALLESGAARVTLDEEKRQKGEIEMRHGSKARKERYNEAANWALVGGLETSKGATINKGEEGKTKVVFGKQGQHEVVITHKPFGLDFRRDGQTQIKFNEAGFLNLEHWRAKVEKPEKVDKPEKPADEDAEEAIEDVVEPSDLKGEDTWWEESFGGNTDSKPRGPESVAIDITFPGYEHVFGIPEHTGPMSLKETRGGDGKFTDPYRLYNSDVFEYIMDSPMTLYGAIPFMQAHKKDSTVGVFWLNAAETWVDIVKTHSLANTMSLGIAGTTDTRTHWISESGLLDFFVLLGPTPQDLSTKYGELTGTTQMPQMFAIAYHQCRWNYVTDQDVKDVDRKFDQYNIPYDVIWLDIEYTDGKKYFTWDPMTFPDPISMEKQLDAHERKLVTIIDPHIKKEGDYNIISELESKDFATKNKDGEQYEGWCWPGSSRWIDAFNPAAIKWWVSLFKYDKFKGTSPNVFIWNDMNEPSVFNGPETTMPKDNLHHGNWEHRDVHNLNGLTFHNATYQALLERDGAKKAVDRKRPFVLTRAFFSGSQRLGAMWTGDNLAEWSHLAASMPMVLNQGISGFPFAGADVGGFFGNPSKELLTRWYQAGAFYPFFRGHAHIDTRRREPYLIGEPYTQIITEMLRLRYQLLPAWYTAFHEAAMTGKPIVRPNFYMHPSDERGFGVDDQMYLADTGLLVKPVTTEGATTTDVYFADATTYYDYFTYQIYAGSAGRTATVSAPLEKLPLFMQAGHIIPRKDRPRRSSGLMRWDPYTLIVVLDPQTQTATGELYIDDGESYEYTEGAYIHRRFTFQTSSSTLTSEDIAAIKGKQTTAFLKKMETVHIEKIVVVGAPEAWKDVKSVSVSEEGKASSGKKREVECRFEDARGDRAAYAVVRKPDVRAGESWKIEF